MLPHLLLAAALLAPADTTHLVLVATTDVHGRAYGWDYVADRPFAGGLARVATVVDSLRARYPRRVIMVDAGDLIQVWCLAITQKLGVKALSDMIAPYPTLGEASKRAAGSYFIPKLFSEKTKKLVRFLAKFG